MGFPFIYFRIGLLYLLYVCMYVSHLYKRDGLCMFVREFWCMYWAVLCRQARACFLSLSSLYIYMYYIHVHNTFQYRRVRIHML